MTALFDETASIKGLSMPVSRIGLGTWAIGGWMWGGTDTEESIKTIQAAVDAGVNLIDTAPVYGFGRSEEIVGEALERAGVREKVAIATKAGIDWTADFKPFRNSSPARLRKELEDSLRRLRTETIDLYQIHWPDNKTPIEDTAATLLKFVEEGKVRALGVSNYSPAEAEAFSRVAPLATIQPPYNLFERGIEADILPWAKAHGVGILAYGALTRGLLSGRITESTTFKGDDLRLRDPKFQSPRKEQYLAAVRRLDAFAQETYGKRVIHLALRWLLDREGVTVALWGARTPQQLAPLHEIAGWRLDAAAFTKIDQIVAETVKDPVGPEFMAPPK